MEEISNINNNDNTQLPTPPPYTSIIYKLDEHESDRNPPPSYSDVHNQAVIYINNYPGPPLTDGHVQVNRDDITINHTTALIPKKIRIYLLVNGIIAIIFGVIAVGLQMGIIAANSIVYYYYGFWGGAAIISIGITIIILNNRHHTLDYFKLFHSFFCQIILLGILFVIGIIIVITDKCNDNATEDNGDDTSCKNSYKILNGFLLTSFALAFLQSIINGVIFGILKRRHPMVSNSVS